MATEGMTFDQAVSELQESGQQEAAAQAAVGPNNPELQQTETPTPGAEAPQEELAVFTTPEVVENSFMGDDFNPDLLPPELQPGFKQLQAAFTKKTQELAEQRKAYEQLGAPEELQQAREFYQSLQDPEYLKAFYGELGGVLDELGLREEAPAASESVAPEAPAPAELPPELAQIAQSDPELAPFLKSVSEMQQRLDTFEAQQAAREQALAEERQLMSQAAEIDRMVQAVREEHPDYGEDDWQAIYDRSVAFDGDVLKAAELYEADKARILESYLSQKQTPHAVTPTPGAAVVTEDEPAELKTLDDAQKAAEAFINANDLSEWTG
jgi:hypothetical protein